MRSAGFAVAIAFLFASVPAVSALTVSKLEVRRLPHPIATRRVLDQVANLLSRNSGLQEKRRQAILFDLFRIVTPDSSLMTPQSLYAVDDGDVRQALDRLASSTVFEPDPMAGPHPRNSLHEYTLSTPYRASPYAGLCVSASLTVLFDPVDKERGPATPVRASDVDTSFQYHLLEERAVPAAREASPAERAEAESDCTKIDPKNDKGMFLAPDDRDAIEGTWLARKVIADAGGGPLPFMLDCGGEDKAQCKAEISHLPLAGSWISGCEISISGTRQCAVQSSGMDMVITVNAADPQRILRVDAHDTVVIADYRAD